MMMAAGPQRRGGLEMGGAGAMVQRVRKKKSGMRETGRTGLDKEDSKEVGREPGGGAASGDRGSEGRRPRRGGVQVTDPWPGEKRLPKIPPSKSAENTILSTFWAKGCQNCQKFRHKPPERKLLGDPAPPPGSVWTPPGLRVVGPPGPGRGGGRTPLLLIMGRGSTSREGQWFLARWLQWVEMGGPGWRPWR